MTLWKVPPGGVRRTDELSRPRTPCGVRPRDRDTGGAADSRERLDPRVHACHDNGAQSGYGLMNQTCQRFTGGPQSSPAPRLAAAPGPAQLASQRPPRVAAQGSVEEAPPLQHDSITTELGAVCGRIVSSRRRDRSIKIQPGRLSAGLWRGLLRSQRRPWPRDNRALSRRSVLHRLLGKVGVGRTELAKRGVAE